MNLSFIGLRPLTLTLLARDKDAMVDMLRAEPDQPIVVTKHGRTVCLIMTPDHYISLVTGEPQEPKVEEPDGPTPQAPFQ